MTMQGQSRILAFAVCAILAIAAVFGVARNTIGDEPTASIEIRKLPPAANQDIDFARDIQPILAKSCYSCHGTETREAGLRLDYKKAALAGGDSGPVIVVGKSAESRLIHLVGGLDQETGLMPPEDEGEPLTAVQVGLLRKWIDDGAVWPDELAGNEKASAGTTHWSFQRITRPPLPPVENMSWPRNPIDHFVLAKLEQEKVAPSPMADSVTLVRRIYLDLIGLPPTPDELNAFLADRRPDAYERLVDRLLESPHYGERWARHWLDLARYADSDGYEKDLARPFAWRYRDWVIDAFNRDLPFDVFTVQQLAGDLLQPGDREFDDAAHIATGFHRNAMFNREAGIDPEEDRVKRAIDRTNTTGTVWLGLSVGCANCHSHKYDPISQREYFSFYAFFNSLREIDPPLNPAETSNEKKRKLVTKDPAMELVQEIVEEAKPRKTYVHLRGDFLSKGPIVHPGTPEVLPLLNARNQRPDRLDLARWLVDRKNPLTARVLVNRLWQGHFGRALVASSDDFGKEGERPTHPELLDWLASELQDGWKLKNIHRLMVTSSVYRQSSAARPETIERDPYNTWLARQSRYRVEAEIVRDMVLTASGLLSRKIGGPSIRPPQPASVVDLTYSAEKDENKWTVSTGSERYRRGLYVWVQRTRPYHSLTTFDAPEALAPCTRRERSNTPLQALTLLNDLVFLEAAHALGHEMAASTNPIRVEQAIRSAFQRCLSRMPTDDEVDVLVKLYEQSLEKYRKSPDAAEALLKTASPDAGNDHDAKLDAVQVAACLHVARAMMNLDEFFNRE
jgi:hypothetical protein